MLEDQHNNYAVRPRDGAISITDLIGYNDADFQRSVKRLSLSDGVFVT